MQFIDQLRAEVRLHGDMETDFRSRRYHQARNLAAKYVDMIEEQARLSARMGDYEHLEEKAVISGFVTLSEKDFEQTFVTITKKKRFMHHKQFEVAVNSENELFEVFVSAFKQLCADENIICHPFQVQILDKKGDLCYQTLPFTILHPKKDRIQGYGFPYQIEF